MSSLMLMRIFSTCTCGFVSFFIVDCCHTCIIMYFPFLLHSWSGPKIVSVISWIICCICDCFVSCFCVSVKLWGIHLFYFAYIIDCYVCFFWWLSFNTVVIFVLSIWGYIINFVLIFILAVIVLHSSEFRSVVYVIFLYGHFLYWYCCCWCHHAPPLWYAPCPLL